MQLLSYLIGKEFSLFSHDEFIHCQEPVHVLEVNVDNDMWQFDNYWKYDFGQLLWYFIWCIIVLWYNKFNNEQKRPQLETLFMWISTFHFDQPLYYHKYLMLMPSFMIFELHPQLSEISLFTEIKLLEFILYVLIMLPSAIHDILLAFDLGELFDQIKYFDLHDFGQVAK